MTLDVVGARPLGSTFEVLQFPTVRVGRKDLTAIAHLHTEDQGLAAGSGAEIPDLLPRLCVN